jgi:hypothetical protein
MSGIEGNTLRQKKSDIGGDMLLERCMAFLSSNFSVSETTQKA